MNGTMEDQRRANALRKIRALLAQASDRAVTEQEAEAFRAKADELMTKFAVEEWEAMQHGPTSIRPDIRDVDMTWWYDNSIDDSDSMSWLYNIWHGVYTHARCVPIDGEWDYIKKTRKVAGFPADLDYADMLFTSLALQLVEKLNPQADPALSDMENYHRLFGAGLSHDECFRRMLTAGCCTDYTGTFYRGTGERPKDWIAYHKPLLTRYQQWRRQNGITERPNPKTYRRSFAAGFSDRLSRRLYDLRRDQDQGESGKFAIVLRDIRDKVQEFVYEEYPHLRPKPIAQTKDTIKKGRRVAAPKPITYDWRAVAAGREAGDKADLAMHPDRRVNRGVAGELED